MSHLLWYPGHELILEDIVRAENATLHDREGRAYVDLESGVWCTSIGHGHPRVRHALLEQLERIGHNGFNYSSPIVEETAREILTLLGFDGGRCVFLCSGSEAVEYGVRMAQSVSTRPLFMTMADSYFGAYGSAHRKLENEWFLFDWMACGDHAASRGGGCADAAGDAGSADGAGDSGSDGGGCHEGCPHWDAIPFDRIGGFLFEPGSSSGLVRFPPKDLIPSIVRAVRERGGLIVVNEVTTGIGRTGKWFGHQHYDFVPDIVAMGKGLGNGYPVAVTGIGPRAVERLGEKSVKYAQSHQNDPPGAAVAREVIRVIQEEGLIERGREIGDVLLSGLRAIAERCDRVEAVRGRGPMIAVTLKDGPDAPYTIRVHGELIRRGFVVGRRPGINVLRIDPPLTIDREDVVGFLEALEEVLTGSGSE